MDGQYPDIALLSSKTFLCPEFQAGNTHGKAIATAGNIGGPTVAAMQSRGQIERTLKKDLARRFCCDTDANSFSDLHLKCEEVDNSMKSRPRSEDKMMKVSEQSCQDGAQTQGCCCALLPLPPVNTKSNNIPLNIF